MMLKDKKILTRFSSLLLAAVLLITVTACDTNPAEESSENFADSSISESSELDTSSETSEPNLEVSSPSSSDASSFEKIQIGITADYEYGVFALDSNGNLYFGADSSTMELVDTEVRDFSYSASSFYVLKKNGDLFSAGSKGYRVGQPLTLFYHNDNAEKISNSIIMLFDGSVLHYQWETEEWSIVDIAAAQIDADYFGAAIIDVNDTLWYLERSTGTLHQIAENVVDCSYRDRNKVYYSSDIWYITSDHKLHIYQTEPHADKISVFPEDIIDVVGRMGMYLVQREDGTLLFGELTTSSIDIGVNGQHIDLFGECYAYIDDEGEIHLRDIKTEVLTDD